MRGSFAELETKLVEALNTAIDRDLVLVQKEYGVVWNGVSWEPDTAHLPGTRGCDILGAVLLLQPQLDADAHKGDHFEAIRLYFEEQDDHILDGECIGRNIANGWDDWPFIGGSQEAYGLGQKLASLYRPLDVDLLSAQSETRMTIAPSLTEAPFELDEDDEDFTAVA